MNPIPRPIGLGVAGLGRIGRLHAEIARFRLEGARLVAVNDVIEGLAMSTGEKLGVKHYTEYDRMLRDPDVDAVIIATPTFLHREMVLRALEEGKHVFVEKPLAVTVGEALDIVGAARRSGLKVQVGYMRRFDYAYRRAKRTIESGGVGRPLVFIGIARDPTAPPGWAADPRRSGGIFLDMLSHDFDLARWLLGSEVEEVFVLGGSYIYEELREKGDLDVVSIVFRVGEAQGYIHGARKNVFGYELRTEVYGTEGTVYVGVPEDPMFAHGTSQGVTRPGIGWFERRFYDAYVEELQSFVRSIAEDREPEVTVIAGARAVEIVEVCWRSFRVDRPVRVEKLQGWTIPLRRLVLLGEQGCGPIPSVPTIYGSSPRCSARHLRGAPRGGGQGIHSPRVRRRLRRDDHQGRSYTEEVRAEGLAHDPSRVHKPGRGT
ncbi:MAG: hypothetical protein DRO39_08600 [Thermoprotei archaeon]|nr:MAG: hypothetical protein DRO39_08600 [Thermoprotei archaeon]